MLLTFCTVYTKVLETSLLYLVVFTCMVKQCRGDGGFKLLATKGVQCVGKLCRNGKLLTFEQTCKEHDRPKKKKKKKKKKTNIFFSYL